MKFQALTTAATLLFTTLTTCNPTPAGNIDCDIQDFTQASANHFSQNIDYVMQRTQKEVPAQLGPGPEWCNRISCSYNSAILLCNDAPHPQTVAWQNVTQYARNIEIFCKHDNKLYNGKQTSPANWYVVFAGDQC